MSNPILTAAALIRDATAAAFNTAARVGALLVSIIAGRIVSVTDYGAATTNSAAANDLAITAALADALAAGTELYWPAGFFQSASNLPNLHSVRHRGPGAIQRTTEIFYLEPRYGQINRLYVRTTGGGGSATNDGLTGSQALTLDQAFANLHNYGPVLNGQWRVVAFAGTYTYSNILHDTPSREPVWLAGPSVGGHPNVPTAIIDGTGAASGASGVIAHGSGVALYVQDVKFTNYNAGTQLNCGLVSEYSSDLFTSNVHTTNCDWAGILCKGTQTARVTGGILDGNRFGLSVSGGSDITFGYQTGCIIQNSTQAGVEWSRGSQGHVDNMTFQDNPRHVDIDMGSRVHLMNNNFKRATICAVSARGNSQYYNDIVSTNNFNNGTADANAVNFINLGFSGESDADLFFAVTERRRAADLTLHAHTGTVAKTTLVDSSTLPTTANAAPWSIPAYWFQDTTKKIRVRATGDIPAGAGTQFGIDFGSTQMDLSTIPGTPGASEFEYQAEIWALAANSQRVHAVFGSSNNAYRMQGAATACPTNVDIPIKVTAQLANSGLTLNLRTVEIFVSG